MDLEVGPLSQSKGGVQKSSQEARSATGKNLFLRCAALLTTTE